MATRKAVSKNKVLLLIVCKPCKVKNKTKRFERLKSLIALIEKTTKAD